MIDIPDVSPEALFRRRDFLCTRATAHLDAALDGGRREYDLHQACAATLHRDAACIALLAGEINEGKELLFGAGVEFAELGLAAGATLMALADPIGPSISSGDTATSTATLLGGSDSRALAGKANRSVRTPAAGPSGCGRRSRCTSAHCFCIAGTRKSMGPP